MDAKNCLESAKGWLEQAEEADDLAVGERYLGVAKAWLEVGSRLESLGYLVSAQKDVDGQEADND